MDAVQLDLGEHGSDSWPEAKLRRSQNESNASGGRSESSGSFSWRKMTFLRICFRLVSYGKKTVVLEKLQLFITQFESNGSWKIKVPFT